MKITRAVVLTQEEANTLRKAQHILANICCEFEQGDEIEQCEMCPLRFCCDYYNHSEETFPNNLYDLIRSLQVETNVEENKNEN